MGYARRDDNSPYVVDGHGPLHLQWVGGTTRTTGLEATVPPGVELRFEIELTGDLSPALALRTARGTTDPDLIEEIAAAVNATAVPTDEVHFAVAVSDRLRQERAGLRDALDAMARSTASARTPEGRARGAARIALLSGREGAVASLERAVRGWLDAGDRLSLAEAWRGGGGGPLRIAIQPRAGIPADRRAAIEAALDRLVDDPDAPAQTFGAADMGLANDLVELAAERYQDRRGGQVHLIRAGSGSDRWATRIRALPQQVEARAGKPASLGWMAAEGRIGRDDLVLVEARQPLDAQLDLVAGIMRANRIDAPVLAFARDGAVLGRPRALEARLASLREAAAEPEAAPPRP